MSWKNVKALKEERAVKFNEAQALNDLAVNEKRDLTVDEEKRHGELLTEVDSYGKRIEREERSAAMGETLAASANFVGKEDTEKRNSVGMPAKDFSKYSVVRAINAKLEGKALDGVEAEVSAELEKRSGKTPKGFYMPIDAKFKNTRASSILDVSNNGTGAIETEVSPDIISALRAKLVTVALGATVMTDMQGNFAIPKQTGTATAYWVAEAVCPTASTQVIGQVLFTPKTVGAFTDISRRFLKNSVVPAEDFVRNDLAAVLARAIEYAALFGTGSSNFQPYGIIPNLVANYPNQIHSQGTNGGALAYTDVVALETLVASQNADLGRLAYLSNAKVRAELKTTPKSSSAVAAGFIYDSDEVNGYPMGTTNLVPSNGSKGTGTNLSTLLFGDFTSMIYALWGGLDVLVDPFTNSCNGTVRVNVMQDVDVNTRHPESFSAITDIVA